MRPPRSALHTQRSPTICHPLTCARAMGGAVCVHLSDALCKRPNTAADLPAVCTQLTVHLERLHKVRPGSATRPPPSPPAEPQRCRHTQDGLLSAWREDSLSRALASQLSAICNSLAPGKSVEVGDARGGRQLVCVCPDRPCPARCRVF